MSSQRIIQDSDDEGGDVRSEVASSCDPLQDPSVAPGRTDAGMARVDESNPDFPIPFSASDLPQVDFDRFLRSESSIMAGDYEDERWVSTANSSSAHVVHVGKDRTEQLRDDSLPCTINATHNALPPTADAAEYGMVAGYSDHPSKRRRISPSQETSHKELEKSTETTSSYNYFASSGPSDTSQAATTLLLPLTTDESHGATTTVLNSLLIPAESPPPTIPFSEDPPYEHGQTITAPIPQSYIQESDPRQPLSETETEALGAKKKRGRPKKQIATDPADTEIKTAPDDTAEVSEQAIKKKPGRPKKQENDTALDTFKDGVTETSSERTLSPSVSKSSKKKIKRSKTTSDIPNKPGELQTESDVIWVESRPVECVQDSGAMENEPILYARSERESTDLDTTKDGQLTDEQPKAPKKRGRKRKETTEGPAPSTESQGVLQDISNIPHAPSTPQDKAKGNDMEMKSDSLTSGLDSTHIPKTPKSRDTSSTGPSADAASNEGNIGQEAGVETPTIASAMQPVKQTPVSSTGKVPFRVGLSRRARIAPLLKVVKK